MRVLSQLIVDFLRGQDHAGEDLERGIQATGTDLLLAVLEARDGYTRRHSSAVVGLSEAVAEVLALDEDATARVKQVALLHDVGKLGISDEILGKEAALTEEEWETIKTHPQIGAAIVAAISAWAHLAPAIAAEHEHWDGSGYPSGLVGDEIPLESRIVFACDAWLAMTSDRPYREGLSPDAATAELERGRGSRFDPRVVDALLFLLRREPTDAAIRRYRHDKNNLAQLISFRAAVDEDDVESRTLVEASIARKRAALHLPQNEDPAPARSEPRPIVGTLGP